jgi:hypothetical protein
MLHLSLPLSSVTPHLAKQAVTEFKIDNRDEKEYTRRGISDEGLAQRSDG